MVFTNLHKGTFLAIAKKILLSILLMSGYMQASAIDASSINPTIVLSVSPIDCDSLRLNPTIMLSIPLYMVSKLINHYLLSKLENMYQEYNSIESEIKELTKHENSSHLTPDIANQLIQKNIALEKANKKINILKGLTNSFTPARIAFGLCSSLTIAILGASRFVDLYSFTKENIPVRDFLGFSFLLPTAALGLREVLRDLDADIELAKNVESSTTKKSKVTE